MILRSRLPHNLKTLSSDFRLDFAGCTVYIASSVSGLFVICKGFRPKRVVSSCPFFEPGKKYTFECATYDEVVNLFLDICKELLSEVPYV